MELQPAPQRMGRFVPASRVINPEVQSSIPSYTHSDITLRDKTKLLQLADRIQTKKSTSATSTTPSSTNRTQNNASRPNPANMKTTSVVRGSSDTDRNNEINRRNVEKTSNLDTRKLLLLTNGSQAPASTPHRPPSSLKKTFTRSKLYSSFSPSKKSSQLLKSDPAKTNIEHLVNLRIGTKPPLFPSGTNNNGFQTLHASFHDKAKLANAFSPRLPQKLALNENNSKLKSSGTRNGVVSSVCAVDPRSIVVQENEDFLEPASYELVNESEAYESSEEYSSATEGRLLTLPKISSAQIIALNKKSSFGSTTSSSASTTDTHDGTCVTIPPRNTFATVKSETEARPSQALGKDWSNKNATAFSHNKDGVSDPTGSCLLPTSLNYSRDAPSSGLSSGSLALPNCGNVDCDTTEGACPQLSRKSFRSGAGHAESSCGSNYHLSSSQDSEGTLEARDDGDYSPENLNHFKYEKVNNNGEPNCDTREENEEEFERKMISSLPKSFATMRDGLRNTLLPGIWSNGEQTFERFDRRSSQPPIPMQCQEERRRKALTLKSEFNPSAQLDSVKMRLKPTEGRPQSLDCSQRKAWMKAYRDMEVSSAVQSSGGDKYSSQQGKLDKSSRKSSLHPTELTPIIRQRDSATVSSAVSDTSSNGIGNNSPKSTGSLFQRFSKTFSLRFGNTSSAGAGSKEDRTNSSSRKKMKARNIAAGSSPDIFSKIECDSNRAVDPSSGKFRNRVPVLKSNREDKCYSGDSGIQIADEHRNNVFPLFAPSRQPGHQSNNGSSPTSPTSMKKLSLVEIPNHIWDHGPRLPSQVAANPIVTSEKLNDDGFVSNDDEAEDPDPDSSERGHSSQPPGYYHSLPLKYSRQRKAAFLEKKLSSARGNVVREIITTEQNYVKTLNDIVQGFLHPCRARKDLFSDKVTGNIFSNIEEILKLHVKLLDSLKSAIDNEDLARSNIGSIFTLWASKFGLYSEYCCHNPMSMATVRQLSLSPEYADFFEACRRLQLMDKLPLHGFLLRPIQRICQYHLQLNELLKQTDVSHEDYEAVQEAVEAMKSVAMNVNDTQRRFDALQEIVRLQASVFEGWEGPDLLETNTVLLHKGDLVKWTEGQKHKEVHVVIFNNEVLICRKDSNKKGTLSFNCRIDLRESVWVNIDSNYEDDYFGMVHNSFRIYRPNKCVWILFTASSPADKKRWTSALEKTCVPYPADLKMVEMAKLTAIKLMFTESQLSSSLFTSSGTLPKLKKSRKGSAISKVDSDAMLIEVGKLRKSGYNQHYQYQSHGPSERSSKFYV